MSKTIKPGAIVWSTRGEQGRYVARVDDGHVVQPCYVDGFDGDAEPPEVYAEGCAVWPAVHVVEPRAVLAPEIVAAEQRLSALRKEIVDHERKRREFDSDMQSVKDRLKQHAALRYVDDMVAGRVPPLCVRFGSYRAPEIVAAADALKNPDKDRSYREPAFKLLTLFGTSAGDLQWHVNHYSDGSGQGTELFFVTTHDEGIEEIRRRYALAVDEWRTRPEDRRHYGEAFAWAYALPEGWIEVPDDVATHVKAIRREAARRTHEQALKALAEAEAKLNAVDAA